MTTVKDEKGHSQVWPDRDWKRFRAERRIQQILSSLKPHSHVLELGCGTGDLTLALLKAGHRVTAVDRSAVMLTSTQARCGSHPALVLVRAEILNFLEKDGAVFDAVVGMGILHHCILDLEITLRLISARLSPQGRGFFWEPNRENPIVRFLFGTSLGRRWMSLEPEEDAFTRPQVENLLRQIFPRFRVTTQDWAYPYVPVALQKLATRWEGHTPQVLRSYISQSLWIEFYRSVSA